MSSSVTSRASCMVEGIVAWFPCLYTAVMCFKWPLGTMHFSQVGQELSFSAHWFPHICHIPKSRLYYRYLAWELMRVVANRLKNEITLFVKLYNLSDVSPFTSVSTYLLNINWVFPYSNPWSMSVRNSHMGSITLFSSHRKALWSKGLMGILSLPWKPVNLDLSEGRQLFPICANMLSS